MCRFDTFNTFLDNVISVLILDALKNIALKLSDDNLLLLERNALQSLLDDPTSIHL